MWPEEAASSGSAATEHDAQSSEEETDEYADEGAGHRSEAQQAARVATRGSRRSAAVIVSPLLYELEEPELFLMGGYSEPSGVGLKVAARLLSRLHASCQRFKIRLACLGSANTCMESGAPRAWHLGLSIRSSGPPDACSGSTATSAGTTSLGGFEVATLSRYSAFSLGPEVDRRCARCSALAPARALVRELRPCWCGQCMGQVGVQLVQLVRATGAEGLCGLNTHSTANRRGARGHRQAVTPLAERLSH